MVLSVLLAIDPTGPRVTYDEVKLENYPLDSKKKKKIRKLIYAEQKEMRSGLQTPGAIPLLAMLVAALLSMTPIVCEAWANPGRILDIRGE